PSRAVWGASPQTLSRVRGQRSRLRTFIRPPRAPTGAREGACAPQTFRNTLLRARDPHIHKPNARSFHIVIHCEVEAAGFLIIRPSRMHRFTGLGHVIP